MTPKTFRFVQRLLEAEALVTKLVVVIVMAVTCLSTLYEYSATLRLERYTVAARDVTNDSIQRQRCAVGLHDDEAWVLSRSLYSTTVEGCVTPYVDVLLEVTVVDEQVTSYEDLILEYRSSTAGRVDGQVHSVSHNCRISIRISIVTCGDSTSVFTTLDYVVFTVELGRSAPNLLWVSSRSPDTCTLPVYLFLMLNASPVISVAP